MDYTNRTYRLALVTGNHQDIDGCSIVVEDHWARVGGGLDVVSSARSGNFAALNYCQRMISAGLDPRDEEAVYGHVNHLGYVVSTRELAEEVTA